MKYIMHISQHVLCSGGFIKFNSRQMDKKNMIDS